MTPGLGTILVGDDGPSARYVAMKHQDCAEIGVESVHEELPGDISQAELESVVRSVSSNPDVDALLIQLPLPKHLNEERALLAVDPDKDVDGLHPVNLGRLVMGAPGRCPVPRRGSSSCCMPTTSRERAARRDRRPRAHDRSASRPAAWLSSARA